MDSCAPSVRGDAILPTLSPSRVSTATESGSLTTCSNIEKVSAMRLYLSKRLPLFLLGSLFLCTMARGSSVEGFTEPQHDVEVAATGEPGLITKINAKEGQKVLKGDVLAVVDTRVLEKSLAIARKKASLTGRAAAMRAELAMRTDRLQKMTAMHSRGHLSQVEIDRARADYEVAEANLKVTQEDGELAKLEVARIEAQIERQTVRSPINGVVVTMHREVGESIVLTDSKLLRLVSLGMLRIKFPMTVAQSFEMEEGGYVQVSLPEINGSATAVVEVISPVLDAGSGTVQVSCLIDNSDGKFRSGMRCVLNVGDEDVPEPTAEEEESLEFEYPSVSIDGK